MLRLALIFSLLLGVNTVAKAEKGTVYTNPYDEGVEMVIEQLDLEEKLFMEEDALVTDLTTLEVIEIEEDVELNFDTKKYLPIGFNPLEGKNDINWNDIELVELEEEVNLGFDPHLFLPNGFDPYEGMESINYLFSMGF